MIFILTTISPNSLNDAINNANPNNVDHLMVNNFLIDCIASFHSAEKYAMNTITGEFIGAYKHYKPGTCDLGRTEVLELAKNAAKKINRPYLTVLATSGNDPLKGRDIINRTCHIPAQEP